VRARFDPSALAPRWIRTRSVQKLLKILSQHLDAVVQPTAGPANEMTPVIKCKGELEWARGSIQAIWQNKSELFEFWRLVKYQGSRQGGEDQNQGKTCSSWMLGGVFLRVGGIERYWIFSKKSGQFFGREIVKKKKRISYLGSRQLRSTASQN
jgi:hypothetical protein